MQTPNADHCDRTPGVPAWMWWLVLTATSVLVLVAATGVVLAMFGWFDPWVALAVGVGVVGAALPIIGSVVADEPEGTAQSHWWSAAAVAVALVIAGWSVGQLGHHVITFHDPGVYASTARLIADFGDLRTELADPDTEPLIAAANATIAGTSLGGPGAYLSDNASGINAEYQFSHAPSIVMAVGDALAGDRGLMATAMAVGVLALLAVFVLASRFVGAGPLALATMTACGLMVPFVYVTRSTYSEPFALAAIAAGLAVLTSTSLPDERRAAVGGAFVASALLFRIDGQLAVVALAGVGCVLAVSGARGRVLAAGAAAAAVPATIGLVDLRWFSGEYWAAQDTGRWALLLATVVAAAIATTAVWIPAWAERVRTTLQRVALPTALTVAALTAAAWLIRPHWFVGRAAWDADSRFAGRVERLQEAEGLAPDGTRSYAEQTVAAIGWYIGPAALSLAIVGIGVLTFRALRDVRRPEARWLAFLVVTVPPFLIDWNVTPYQPWASRRLVPVILPAFIVLAAFGARWVVDAACSRLANDEVQRQRIGASMTGLASMAIVLPTALGLWPVRSMADQRGFLTGLEQACGVLDGASTLVVGSERFTIPTRAWCGSPALAVVTPNDNTIEQFAELAGNDCVRAGIIVELPHADLLSNAADRGLVEPPVAVGVVNPWAPEESILGAPDAYAPAEHLEFLVSTVRLPTPCT